MPQLHITKIHISLKIKIPDELLERHLASSAEAVGHALTEEVLKFVKKNKMGYFPALEYIQSQGEMDEDLMDAAETIGWFTAKIAREEIQNKLRGFFSTLSFQSVQTIAFAMPSVRPNTHKAHQQLIDHYTPNVVKLDIVASVLKKEQLEGIANWAKQLFKRNLETSFAEMEVTQTVVM